MNTKPKTFWHKSWPTPPWFRLWLLLLALTLVIMTCLIASRSFGLPDWPTIMIVPVFSAVAATLLLVLWWFIRWFGWFCWHQWRRALFLLACLATAVALFYAEEDWRGRHDWDQFRRAGEARGEQFDPASMVPPPVPDDQNFALSSIMFSTYGSYFDRTGHENHPYNTNVVDRLDMNYWGGHYDATNWPGDWTLAIPTDLTPLQQFYRNLAAKTNLFPVPLISQSPAADVLLALRQFSPTIEELRQASQLPDSRFPLAYTKADPAAILLPQLAALKRSTLVLQLRVIAEVQTGQGGHALADVALMARLIDAVRTEPFLVSHLVRLELVTLMLQPVWEGLADHLWSESQLAELNTGLARFDFVSDYQLGVRGERAMLIKAVHYLRDHPELYPDLIPSFRFDKLLPTVDMPMVILSKTHLVPSGWYYQNQLHCARLMDQYLAVANPETHTFNPAMAGQAESLLQNEHRHISPFNTLACIRLSRMEQFSAPNGFVLPFARTQSSVDLARVAIALERCRLAQGKYPDSLDALAPLYLNPVPHDVIDGQPLHYRLTPDGQFVLYSIGWNERDDGGVVVLQARGAPQSDPAQGDWVWRYPQK